MEVTGTILESQFLWGIKARLYSKCILFYYFTTIANRELKLPEVVSPPNSIAVNCFLTVYGTDMSVTTSLR